MTAEKKNVFISTQTTKRRTDQLERQYRCRSFFKANILETFSLLFKVKEILL